MTATISDLTGYLSPFFALYPALPSGFKEQIARSLTALQDAYFEELNARKKVEVLSCMEVDQAAALLKRLAKPERNMLISG